MSDLTSRVLKLFECDKDVWTQMLDSPDMIQSLQVQALESLYLQGMIHPNGNLTELGKLAAELDRS